MSKYRITFKDSTGETIIRHGSAKMVQIRSDRVNIWSSTKPYSDLGSFKFDRKNVLSLFVDGIQEIGGLEDE